MASPAVPNPDMPITLKVSLDGVTRRFKLPLRDLSPSNLENKLRSALNIPQETGCLFERYSDSAASYVVLDRNNVSVYKQLYRAAKAKQKLKLRLTTWAEEEKKVNHHQPPTVEDEPETASPASAGPSVPATAPISNSSSPAEAQDLATDALARRQLAPELAWQKSIAQMEQEQEQMERKLEMIEATMAAVHNRPPVPPPKLPIETAEVKTTSSSLPFVVTQSACEASSLTGPSLNYAVCCNSCDKIIPDAHYHCSTCDDGDFDLCQDCVDRGITCYGLDHWLLKRFIKDGVLINSTTETIAPKPRVPKPEPPVEEPPLPLPTRVVPIVNAHAYQPVRTCNSCVQDFAEHEFVHCTACPDFDLCQSCFVKDQHGHNPKHAFVPVVDGTALAPEVSRRLAPGRNAYHHAICDQCNSNIRGVRHKCLDCPDWDYCSDCVLDAPYNHPGHRFVPVYEPIENPRDLNIRYATRPVHFGIFCDGPLCNSRGQVPSYIVGDRYKCALCVDTDFCANCEASPINKHNKTHPLIKFKTPVRNVSVTTTGDNGNGQPLPVMGDRVRPLRRGFGCRAREFSAPSEPLIAQTHVVTVADVRPSSAETAVTASKEKTEKAEVADSKEKHGEEKRAVVPPTQPSAADLVAVYQSDTVADGTVLPPNHVFEQTWILRNQGNVAWPAGCSVKFVGGDYMCDVDPNHPVAADVLISAAESNVCEVPLAPRQEFPFTVRLRTPWREGKVISYWRLVTKDGIKFGHRLWCDVNVRKPEQAAAEEAKPPVSKEETADAASEAVPSDKMEQGSQMIFPKLDKESPAGSIHEAPATTDKSEPVKSHESEYEECNEDDEWADGDSDEGFLTDEEYDILDASDEEYLSHEEKKPSKN
ncbi:hypothetical protein VTK73DRAFT_337 [Phialemonium thermophilum]|uniref:ZZ-type domain-containing protein n=1 Tax=Phialemonium thermophilum TaxID=223376 RepID=A0ABR3XER5_9PEZI